MTTPKKPPPFPTQKAAESPQPADGAPTRRVPDAEPEGTGLSLGVPHPSLGGDTDFDPPVSETSALAESSDPFEPGDLHAKRGSRSSLELDMSEVTDALDLVGRQEEPETRRVGTPSSDPLIELRERYALGDFSGALQAAETILRAHPGHTDALRYASSCRDVLEQMYFAKLGALDQVPVVAVPSEQLRWLTLDHRAGFLLSHVDGVSSLEEILDVSGMQRIEAMKIILDLMHQKVIVLQ